MIIFYVITLITPEKTISILIIIIFTYFINMASYYYRDYLDIKSKLVDLETNKKKKKNTNRQLIIDILGKDNLTEEAIEEYCISRGAPKLSEAIYLFLNNTLEETADILGVDTTTITRRIKRFIEIGLKD